MNVYQYFERSRATNPSSACLRIGSQSYSYQRVSNLADHICMLISDHESSSPVGILAHRSLSAYTGVLASLKAGLGYVPLSSKLPIKRNVGILESAGIETLIVDSASIEYAIKLLKFHPCKLIFPEDLLEEVCLKLPEDAIVFTLENMPKRSFAMEAEPSNFAYLLFTSGSTGKPKGVPVSHANVVSYVDHILNTFCFSSADRFSQIFDLTFDLSVHDMFICWATGATLCIPNKPVLSPIRYIKDHNISVWFSVPSLIHFMQKSNFLQAGAFSTIRFSFFCGEPLSTDLVSYWQQACPNSEIVNIYGPTEVTIGCSFFRWDSLIPKSNKSWLGIVSIGNIFSTLRYCILNDEGIPAGINEVGELCLSGDQLVNGYWKNDDKTREQFVQLSETGNTIWYKTGDLVMEDEEHDIFYLSRKDFQVKINGYRVELEEINCVVKQFTGAGIVISVPYNPQGNFIEGIYTFIDTYSYGQASIINYCREWLPEYMVPHKIVFLEEFPVNGNGKIDRNALLQLTNQKNEFNLPN